MAVHGYGYHEMRTILMIAFDGPLALDAVRAAANSVILDARGHRVAVTLATYETSANSVTLHTAWRLNVHLH